MSPTGDRDASQQSWGMILKRAEQNLLRAKGAALKPAGLTLAQYVALDRLQSEPGITAASLARACLVTPQAMMVVLKAMDEQGLIERSVHPRHSNVLELRLTAVAREALDHARQLVAPLEQRLDEAISDDDARVLTEMLGRIIEVTETG